MILETISIILSIIAIAITYLNYRDQQRGILRLDFLGYEKRTKNKTKKQEVVERKPFYVNIKNLSNVVIKNLKLETYIIYKNKKFLESTQILPYLNPEEEVDFTKVDKNFRKKHKELFETIKKGNGEYVTPKENLQYKIKFILTWGGFMKLPFFKFKQKDDFDFEWQSYHRVKYELDEYYHENCIRSYNKRNGFYIYKK